MSPDEQYCVSKCIEIYTPGEEGSDICSCASHLAPDGRGCLAECGSDQDAVSVKDSSLQWCLCKAYLDVTGYKCVPRCGGNQKEVSTTPTEIAPHQFKRCVCDDNSALSPDTGKCILKSQCDRLQAKDDYYLCLSGTCKENYKLVQHNKTCVL